MRSLGPGPEIAGQPVSSVSPRLTRDDRPRRVAQERRASGASGGTFYYTAYYKIAIRKRPSIGRASDLRIRSGGGI
jgi:hypothetical protein